MTIKARQCTLCSHFTTISKMTCKAFPEGIPGEIWSNKVSHRQPYSGDNGIVFELKDKLNKNKT